MIALSGADGQVVVFHDVVAEIGLVVGRSLRFRSAGADRVVAPPGRFVSAVGVLDLRPAGEGAMANVRRTHSCARGMRLIGVMSRLSRQARASGGSTSVAAMEAVGLTKGMQTPFAGSRRNWQRPWLKWIHGKVSLMKGETTD